MRHPRASRPCRSSPEAKAEAPLASEAHAGRSQRVARARARARRAALRVSGRTCSVSPVFCFGTWYTTMLSLTRTRVPIGNAAPADCAAAVIMSARRAVRLATRARGCTAPGHDTAASISLRRPPLALQAARYAARRARFLPTRGIKSRYCAFSRPLSVVRGPEQPAAAARRPRARGGRDARRCGFLRCAGTPLLFAASRRRVRPARFAA